jgi:hypothetical protein
MHSIVEVEAPWLDLDWSTADDVIERPDKQYRQAYWSPGTIAPHATMQGESWAGYGVRSQSNEIDQAGLAAKFMQSSPLGGLLHRLGLQIQTMDFGQMHRVQVRHLSTPDLRARVEAINDQLPSTHSITPVAVYPGEVFPAELGVASLAQDDPEVLTATEAWVALHDQTFHCVWFGIGKATRLAIRDRARAVLRGEVPVDPNYEVGNTPETQYMDRIDYGISLRSLKADNLTPTGRNARLVPYAFQRAIGVSAVEARALAEDTWRQVAFLGEQFGPVPTPN